MSEDFPQPNPDELQKPAEGQQSPLEPGQQEGSSEVHIPISDGLTTDEDNRPHAEVPEFPTGTFTKDSPDDSGRVEDESLALDMAYAGKEKRDQAVAERERASSSFAESERRGGDWEWKKSGKRHTERADELDDSANRVEEWVKVLHEHPVPEGYLESRNVTALGLAALEEKVLDWQETIDSKLGQLDSSPLLGIKGFDIGWRQGEPVNLIADAFGAVPGAGGSYERSGDRLLDCPLDRFDDEADRLVRFHDADPEGIEKLKAYREALENPETTLGQLRDMYAEAYTKKYLEPLRSNIEKNTALLDDIRSGNARSVTEDAETQSQ